MSTEIYDALMSAAYSGVKPNMLLARYKAVVIGQFSRELKELRYYLNSEPDMDFMSETDVIVNNMKKLLDTKVRIPPEMYRNFQIAMRDLNKAQKVARVGYWR